MNDHTNTNTSNGNNQPERARAIEPKPINADAHNDDHLSEEIRAQDERERLIGRVIDGEARPEDWAKLQAIAGQDASIWQDLEVSADQRRLLESIVDSAGNTADQLDLEDLPGHAEQFATIEAVGADYGSGGSNARAMLGWAAAAAVALAWGFGVELNGSTMGSAAGLNGVTQQAAGINPATPDEAFQNYLELGREQGLVLEELNRPVIQTRPLADGSGVEVVFVRQIVERRRVQDTFEVYRDEFGRPVALPASPRDIYTFTGQYSAGQFAATNPSAGQTTFTETGASPAAAPGNQANTPAQVAPIRTERPSRLRRVY